MVWMEDFDGREPCETVEQALRFGVRRVASPIVPPYPRMNALPLSSARLFVEKGDWGMENRGLPVRRLAHAA